MALVADEAAGLEGAQQRAWSGLLPEGERREAAQLEQQRRADFDDLQRSLENERGRRAAVEKENMTMKVVVAGIGALVLGAGLIAFALRGGNDGNASTRGAAPGPRKCAAAQAWDNAASKIGVTATLRGRVRSATYAKTTKARPTYLNVGKPFPQDGRLVIVVFGKDRPNFRRPPEDTYQGKDVAVTGEVKEFRGNPEVVVNHPNDLAICE